MVRQSDGKLVIAGWSGDTSRKSFALVRYTPDFSLDTTFGNGGAVTTPFGYGDSRAEGLVTQPDGKLVAAGWAGTVTGVDFALARYNINGSLDTTEASIRPLAAAARLPRRFHTPTSRHMRYCGRQTATLSPRGTPVGRTSVLHDMWLRLSVVTPHWSLASNATTVTRLPGTAAAQAAA